MTTNLILRIVLLLWVVGYLVMSCSGIVRLDPGGALLGLFGGILLFVPWLLGTIVLALGVWLTNPRGPAGPR
jgi:hypothetical protein